MSKSSPASTTQTTTTEFPTELRPYITDILERAKSRAESQESEGFQPYTGPRIAERTPEQTAAEAGTKGVLAGGVATSPILSSAQTYYTPALGLTLGQAEQFGAPQAAQYMSPYQQAVIDVEKREAMRGFQPQIQQIGAQAARAGGFGGSRQAILEAEAQRNLNQQIGDIQTRGLQAAYDRGLSAFEAQKARERGAATSLAQMGAALPGQALKEVGALEALGATKRADTQRALDLAYGQFMEEQTYPTKTLQEYQSIIRGFPFTPSTYQTTSAITPPASLAQNILGIGTGIAGLYGAFGGVGAKVGGHLAKLQEAGSVGSAQTVGPADTAFPMMSALKKFFESKDEETPEYQFKEGEERTVSTMRGPVTYRYKDGEFYRIKEDGTLAKSPASPSLITANLRNVDEEGVPESSIVATDEKPIIQTEQQDISTLIRDIIPGGAEPDTTQRVISPSATAAENAALLAKQQQGTDGSDTGAEAPVTTTQPSTNQTKPEKPTPPSPPTKEEDGKGLTSLQQMLKQIQDRETLSPEMKAYQAELANLREGLGKKEGERKEELKKQKYLQLAEFGRGLLGADTTKGLLAQIAQAGEKPLTKVAEIVGEEGKLGEKTQAEKLALLKGEGDIGQSKMASERQQLADTLSVQAAIQKEIDNKIKLGEWGSGISTPTETTMNNIAASVLGADIVSMTDPSKLSKLETAKTNALQLWSSALNSDYKLRNDPALADAKFREIFSELVKGAGIVLGPGGKDSTLKQAESANSAMGASDQFAPS